MKVLLTGPGFIGSRLAEVLTQDGHEVVTLVRYEAQRSGDDSQVWGDLRDADLLRILRQVQPGLVLHLAALASNDIANVLPSETMAINGYGTARLVEACEQYGSVPFVLASSSEVYKQPGVVEALNPYAASKIAAEQVVRASNLPWVISRAFNTYGRALIDLPRFVIDRNIVRALTEQEVTLRDPDIRRDFIFREDHVDAYRKIVQALGGRDITGKTFDFGTGSPVSMGELMQVLAERTGATIRNVDYRRSMDVPVLCADPKKAEEVLGWRAMDFHEGLHQAIDEWKERLGV